MIVLVSSSSAGYSPVVVHVVKYGDVRVCALLCDGRRFLKIGKVDIKKENDEEGVRKQFLHCVRKKANIYLKIGGQMVEENGADDVSVRITVYRCAPVRRLVGCRLYFYRNSCGKRQKRV